MKTITKIKIISVLVLLIIVAVYFVSGKTRQEQDITIGAVYTLTGINSDIGKAIQEGTEIALETINSSGGIKGKSVNVIYEDAPNLDPTLAVNGAQKLMTVDKVSLVLDFPYTGLSSMKTFAEQNRVPVMSVIDASDEIASFGEWVFGGGIYADEVGREVARFAHDSQNIRKAAVLVGKDEYLLAVSNGFEDRFVKLGGEIVVKEEFLLGDTDFRTQLLKIKTSGAEAIFVSHFGEAGLIVKQATELGYRGIFLGSDTFSIADVQKVAGSALDGRTYFALWKNFDSTTPEQERFSERYKAKYGKEPGDYLFYNVLGYDGMMVAAEALKSSDLSGESIKDALYKIKDFPGLSGPITIDETGINRDPKSAIVMYKDGRIVRYESK